MPRPSSVTLRFVPGEMESDTARAAWMFEAGCRRQAERLLANIVDENAQ